MDIAIFGSCGAHAWSGDEEDMDQNDHRQPIANHSMRGRSSFVADAGIPFLCS